MRPARRRLVAALTTALGLCSAGALAQSLPDTENGRYTLSPAADGMLRLDTRTGQLSTCSDKGNGWACYTTPDERAAFDAEIGRLQQDNERLKQAVDALQKDKDSLKAQLAARDSVAGKIDEPLPKADSLKKPEITTKDGARKLEIPLPSDRDLDRVMAFLENAWKRLLDLANKVQKDVTGEDKI
ncbi:hypothetical protein OO17_19295 [Rhodopseudomonas palustris]|uniref:Uncharacterized protein n=1 Tax=Rhodopseudomonas palustris TaxID=1076 RepID=A0A0D7EK44_RHOPL|nr:hypothetical protein OO17_19295 [Rhodopseudomonas palustris]